MSSLSFPLRLRMLHRKGTINHDRGTIALEDQDTREKVKRRIDPNQLLTNWSLFATTPITHGKVDMGDNSYNNGRKVIESSCEKL